MIFVLLLWMAGGDAELVTARPADEAVMLTGYTRARDVLRLSAEVSARCEAVFADVGDTVPDDGRFAQLDATFAELELRAARGRLAQLMDRLAYLEKEEARYADLLKSATVSQAVFDERKNQTSQARLEAEVLTVEVDTLRERLARHRLSAPAGWTVIRRDLVPGTWVTPGTVIAEFGDYTSLVVPFALDTAQHAWAETTRTFEVALPDFGLRLPARLLRQNPRFDETARKTEVQLVLERDLPARRGGLRVRWTLHPRADADVVELPERALQKRYEAWWLLRPDGTELRVTHLGQAPSGLVRVRADGLQPGDRFQVRQEP